MDEVCFDIQKEERRREEREGKRRERKTLRKLTAHLTTVFSKGASANELTKVTFREPKDNKQCSWVALIFNQIKKC